MIASYQKLEVYEREGLSEAWQALCFFAGADYPFIGEKLLTANEVNVLAITNYFKHYSVFYVYFHFFQI